MACANCAAFGDACTYSKPAKRRSPPKRTTPSSTSQSQVPDTVSTSHEALVSRIQELEAALKKLSPTIASSSPFHPSSPPNNAAPSESDPTHNGISSFEGDVSDSSSDEEETEPLSEWISKLRINPLYPRPAVGSWSGRKLVASARQMKQQVFGDTPEFSVNRRPEKWSIPAWEKHVVLPDSYPGYDFPPEDLAPTLVSHFFAYFNPYMPIFHRPSFSNNVKQGLHLEDSSFATAYLLVCAIGSWYSEDPRVLLAEDDPRSAGWKWFNQVDITRRSPYASPTLYDFQTYCLSLAFLHSSSTPGYCWMTAGIGLRMAIDVGLHRRKAYGSTLTPYTEQLKRTFWTLVIVDHVVATATGRPPGTNDNDIDLDLPVDCDDEYWTTSKGRPAFRQPEGKPTHTYFFIHIVRLREIENYALKSLFPAKRSRFGPKTGGHLWEQRLVAEIDSHLNKWRDEIPNHLQWEQVNEATDIVTYHQAAFLRSAFHMAMIVVHRTYISSRKMSALSLPSLAICTNSARSIAYIADKQLQRGEYPLTHLHTSAFQAGAVLLLRIWGQKLSGIRIDYAKEMEDVKKCLAVLKHCERMIALAAHRWDILNSLALGIESIDDGSPATQATPPAQPNEPEPTSAHPRFTETGPLPPTFSPTNGLQDIATHQPVPPFLPPALFPPNAGVPPVSGHYQALFESTLPPNPSMPSTHPSVQLAGSFEATPIQDSYAQNTGANNVEEILDMLGDIPISDGQPPTPAQPSVWQDVFTGSELDIWSSFFGDYGGDFQMVNATLDPTTSLPNELFAGGFNGQLQSL